jgi:FKBP-type peptidyl-prolyl cis-trans isomerase
MVCKLFFNQENAMKRNLLLLLGMSVASLVSAQPATTTTPATTPTTPTTLPSTPITTMPGTAPTTTPATTIQTSPVTTVNISEQNAKEGAAFMANNKNQPGVITTPSGLQYKVLQTGMGPKPTRNDIVTVDYEGKHLNGQIFDSSYQRNQSATFPVGAVIPGWQEALQMMPQGSLWELYIPANLAYGERGAPGAIAPNETLVFKVHLINVQPGRP